ncbi:hypothetical protein QBC41DRAFT_320553 [Cercophora samala]|uniref:Uncharacterized protein n=1 Tax=Cercophora samala TaxID=330535 RepID=A0AA40DA78_9PEZI|nr:hypothetical protein QBC41DRAFT_320553 [Cercophora samala]
MSKLPMAPPKATSKASLKAKEESKPNLFAMPEYKPPVNRGRRNGRYRGGHHIAHSVGNFRIKTVYNRERDQVRMTISSIHPFTPSALRKERSEVNWTSVEETIFEKLRRARFNIQPILADFDKLGVGISEATDGVLGLDSIPDNNSIMFNAEVYFNVRPFGNLVQPTPMRPWSNDSKSSHDPVIKFEPISTASSASLVASQKVESALSRPIPASPFTLSGIQEANRTPPSLFNSNPPAVRSMVDKAKSSPPGSIADRLGF